MIRIRRRAASVAALAIAAAGCAAPGVGLRPIYTPATRSGGVDDVKSYGQWWLGYAQSARPLLRWAPLPTTPGAPADAAIRDVVYDLRVWRSSAIGESERPPMELVDARDGLAAPEHRLEEPLALSAQYVWSVRARFEEGGRPRVTEWGGLKAHARLPIEPNPWRYRFTTPHVEGDANGAVK